MPCVQLSADRQKVRRKQPEVASKDVDACTIYVERLPPLFAHDDIKALFARFGTVEYIRCGEPQRQHVHSSSSSSSSSSSFSLCCCGCWFPSPLTPSPAIPVVQSAQVAQRPTKGVCVCRVCNARGSKRVQGALLGAGGCFLIGKPSGEEKRGQGGHAPLLFHLCAFAPGLTSHFFPPPPFAPRQPGHAHPAHGVALLAGPARASVNPAARAQPRPGTPAAPATQQQPGGWW